MEHWFYCNGCQRPEVRAQELPYNDGDQFLHNLMVCPGCNTSRCHNCGDEEHEHFALCHVCGIARVCVYYNHPEQGYVIPPVLDAEDDPNANDPPMNAAGRRVQAG